MNFASKEQVEFGRRLGIDVSNMSKGEARDALTQAALRRSALNRKKAEEAGILPGCKIRRLNDGREAEFMSYTNERNGIAGARIKGHKGTFVIIDRDGQLLWEVVA